MEERMIRIAIAGIGNCASSLIQGIFYYSNLNNLDSAGLMHKVLGDYRVESIIPVAAFDIDKRKVGRDLREAIFSLPNNTKTFYSDVPNLDVIVQKGPVLDGFPSHMENYPEKQRFVVDKSQRELEKQEIVSVLKESGAEMLVNYMPVGSEQATNFYAECALESGCGFVNCMPVFIASDAGWAKRFEEKNLPCLGDDIKAQLGATILHRTLAKLFVNRGVAIDRTYQLNIGGNTDFLNMLERERLKSKKISKTEAVQSQLPTPLHPDNVHIGPSDFVPWQNDNKVCFLRIEGKGFGDIPMNLELRLSVEDSPNSAGVAIDAIRCMRIALDRGISGALYSASAWFMKHPPRQYSDNKAMEMVEDFIKGEIER